MKLLGECFCVLPLMKVVILCCFILATYFNEGLSHVGEKCRLWLICFAKNSYCDSQGICRCKQDYPVNVTPHDCRKGRRHRSRCQFTEECRYYDANSYCTQIPYHSVCDCNLDLIYDEQKKLCVQGPQKKNSYSTLLPTVLGISLGIASMFCCCLTAWHCCQRHQHGEETLFRQLILRARNSRRNTSENNNRRITQVPSTDVLPPYEMIVKENEDDELPPSYDEAMKQGQLQGKV